MLDRMAVFAQLPDQPFQPAESTVERLQIGDLAADMHVDAGHFDAVQLGGERVDFACIGPGDAELVFLFAGRNLRMGTGIDIGVDAEGNPRPLSRSFGTLRQRMQFGHRLDIEAENVGGQSGIQFGCGLADTREHDLVRRNSGRQRPLEFPAGDDVGATAKLCQRLQHGLVGIGFHGVADKRWDIAERTGKHIVVARQRGGRIAIERRTDLACDQR